MAPSVSVLTGFSCNFYSQGCSTVQTFFTGRLTIRIQSGSLMRSSTGERKVVLSALHPTFYTLQVSEMERRQKRGQQPLSSRFHSHLRQSSQSYLLILVLPSHFQSSLVILNHPSHPQSSHSFLAITVNPSHPQSSLVIPSHPQSSRVIPVIPVIPGSPQSPLVIPSHPKSSLVIPVIPSHPQSSLVNTVIPSHPQSSW